jgi:eukaryotic-like serine/threonine-protein kinase
VYEMLAGEPPFKGPNPQATLMRRFMGPPRPLRPMVQIPEHVERAIVRALAKDPAERYATAAEFAEALAGREPTRPTAPASPPPDAAGTPRAGKRGCAAVLLLAAGLAGAAVHLLGSL